MHKLTRFAIALSILASAAAGAQPGHHGRGPGGPRGLHGPGGPAEADAHHMQRVSQRLELTAEQQERWQELVSKHRESLLPLFDEAKALHEQAQELTQSEDPDPAALGQLHLDARAIHQDIATSREILQATLNDTLTVAQQDAWEAMRANGPRRGHGREHGPGRGHHEGGRFGGGPAV